MIKKYHKIGQVAELIRTVKHLARFDGLDENKEPIYNTNPLPTIEFKGTVKLHGTNAGIGYDNGEIWFQSRSHKVTNGHFGFTEIPRHEIDKLIKYIKVGFYISDSSKFIVFGEFAGQGIQKGIGISSLPKKFYIFDIFVFDDEEGYYLDLSDSNYLKDLLDKDASISLINKYWSCTVAINFDDMSDGLDQIKTLVNQIEKECPVAKYYGVSGIGEGIVFKGYYENNRLVFKSKGEKHQISKGRVDKDPVKEKLIENFANNFVTQERIRQAIFELSLQEPDKKDTGNIVKWVNNDILEEEKNTLQELGLTNQEVSSKIGRLTANIFFDLINLI